MNKETYDKIEWIDINLPWRISSIWADAPQVPNLEQREREVFGASSEDLREQNAVHLENFHLLLNALEERQYQARQEAKKRNESNYELSSAYDQIEIDFWEEHTNNPDVIARDTYRASILKINAWTEEQPEWKAYVKDSALFSAQEDEKSFCGRGLANPGTVIELANGQIELIGSINESSGVCDDCAAFDRYAVVKRYAVVYPFTRTEANDTSKE